MGDKLTKSGFEMVTAKLLQDRWTAAGGEFARNADAT